LAALGPAVPAQLFLGAILSLYLFIGFTLYITHYMWNFILTSVHQELVTETVLPQPLAALGPAVPAQLFLGATLFFNLFVDIL